MWLSYQVIQNFCQLKLNSKKLTFFTTGTVVKTAPSLIKKIHNDGHEISSHYFSHDLMTHQNISTIENNFVKSIEAIESVTGCAPKGFRAPAFSIPCKRKDVFDLIAKYFDYDSSYVLSSSELKSQSYRNSKIFSSDTFTEFPIIPMPFMKLLNVKSGGTFLRVFPKETIKKTMDFSRLNSFIPQVYMHPYDYLVNKEFWVDYEFFKKQKFIKGLISWYRQNQWLGFGNHRTLNNIEYLLEFYSHIGRIGFEKPQVKSH